MAKEKNKLQLALDRTEMAVNKTNILIETLGFNTNELYLKLTEIQDVFNQIRNVPDDTRLEYEAIKQKRIEWKNQVEKIEEEYNAARNKANGGKIVGVGAGIAVASLGPTVAMGIATTFGVASTGTAISSLSGIAATNAALAWLGGGALATGGGGVVAGKAFLALAGPIGWTIAGVSLLGTAAFMFFKSKERENLEKIYTLISERDIRNYELASIEINKRIFDIGLSCGQLYFAVDRIRSFGNDYSEMLEPEQYELGSYVNLMKASTNLLLDPIKGIQPKIMKEEAEEYLKELTVVKVAGKPIHEYSDLITYLANLLYKIGLNVDDMGLLWRSLRENKDLLEGMNLKKEEFEYPIMPCAQFVCQKHYQIVERQIAVSN